jgi:hypothetical protein
MEPNLPTFMFIHGQNADAGREILINLNQIRQVEIEDKLIRLHFSEAHVMEIGGSAMREIIAFFGMHCITTKGQPFRESLMARFESLGPEQS